MCLLVVFFSSRQACAGEVRHAFDQPRLPFRQAVIDLAVTADISLGGVDPALCGTQAPALHGHMSAEQALRHILKGSRCDVDRVDSHTFRLRRAFAEPAPAAAIAEPTEPPKEVIVTGYRRRQTLGASPAALSVISGDTLRAYGDGLRALSARVPGFTTTNLGPGRDKILLRGLSDGVFTGRTQSTVGLYLDDTPITFDAPDPDLLLVDMAQVEVLKGPQGALYGQGSISGVVRLITNKPALGKLSGNVSAGLAATANGAPSSRLSVVLNLPLIKDRLAVRLVGYDDRSGGYIDDVAIGRADINKTRRLGGRAIATWRLDDQWRLTGTVAGQAIDNRNSQYVSGALGPYTRAVPINEPHDNDFNETALTLSGEMDWATLKVSLNHLHHHLTSRYDAEGIASWLSVPVSGQLAYDEAQQVELVTQEISLVSPSHQRLSWLGGLYNAESRETFSPDLTEPASNRILFSERRQDRILDRAVFGEASYDLTPAWRLTGGLRGTWNSHRTQSLISEAASSEGLSLHQADYHLSHTLSLRYQPHPDMALYFQTSEGYRSGGFNTTKLASQLALPTHYDGDELNNYEAGLKVGLPAHNATFNLALFRFNWTNIQSDQIQSSGLPVTVNIGDGANTGLELEAGWHPLDTLNLTAVAQFNDPHLTRANPAYATAENAGLPLISKISASVSGDWSRHLGTAIWQSRATLAYRSPSRLNFGALQKVTMDGYTTLDLATSLTAGPLTYDLRLDNATGTAGNSFAYGNPFSLSRTQQSTPLRPRTLWFTLRVNY